MFIVAKHWWPALCSRLDQLLGNLALLLEVSLPEPVDAVAQRLFAQLVARGSTASSTESGAEFVEVDFNSLEY